MYMRRVNAGKPLRKQTEVFTMRKLSMIISAGLAAALLAGCAASPKTADNYSYSRGVSTEEASYDMAAAEAQVEAESESQSAAGGYGAGETDPNYGNHKIITTYSFDMQTDEFDGTLKQLQEKAAQLGGYVQSSAVSGTKPETYTDSGRDANLAFRIPTGRAKEFVEFTEGAGEVTYSNCNTEDITLSYFDTETRLEVLRNQLDRLKEIMKTAESMEDIVELEKAISETTLEIEQYTTQLRRYDDLVDFTTVYVNVYENRLTTGPASKKGIGERISAGLAENFAAVGVFFENALVSTVSALPILLVVAVLAAIVLLIIRLIRKGKPKRDARREARSRELREKMDKLSSRKKNTEGEEKK